MEQSETEAQLRADLEYARKAYDDLKDLLEQERQKVRLSQGIITNLKIQLRDKPKPPTRLQIAKRKISSARYRITDAWSVLIGHNSIEED